MQLSGWHGNSVNGANFHSSAAIAADSVYAGLVTCPIMTCKKDIPPEVLCATIAGACNLTLLKNSGCKPDRLQLA